ncbi:hypothetical protein KQI84_00535 [bacterium]|nr:hypothetical protein [bacterium]
MPEYLMLAEPGRWELLPWDHFPERVFNSRDLAREPRFFEQYRAAYIRTSGKPPLYIYFMQRRDLPDIELDPELDLKLVYEPEGSNVAKHFIEVVHAVDEATSLSSTAIPLPTKRDNRRTE